MVRQGVRKLQVLSAKSDGTPTRENHSKYISPAAAVKDVAAQNTTTQKKSLHFEWTCFIGYRATDRARLALVLPRFQVNPIY
jgi:hypothetical protein